MNRSMYRLATVAFGLVASTLFSAGAHASAMQQYGTVGAVLQFGGVSGPQAVSFSGVPSGNVADSNPFSLGDFVVTPSADGSASTYTSAPFQILVFGIQAPGSTPGTTVPVDYVISGHLDGSVSSTTPSTLVATVDSAQATMLLPVPGSGSSATSPISLPVLAFGGATPLAASGSTPLSAQLQNTPEPSTLAILAAAGAGVALRKRLRRARG